MSPVEPLTTESRPFLRELQQHPTKTEFRTWVLLRKAEERTGRTGSKFLTLEISDSTQAVFCTLFTDHVLYAKMKDMSSGTILKVQGEVDFYQGRFSPRLLKIAPLEKEEWTQEILSRMIRSSPKDVETMYADVLEAVDSIQNLALRRTILTLLTEEQNGFCYKPAAKGIHHAYRSGLLEHTWSMLTVARRLLSHYENLHADLVIAGIIMHDYGKMFEYEGELSTQYSRQGNLLGHIYIGSQKFHARALREGVDEETIFHMVHIILSHHRMPEWGASVRPATPEAIFVCMVDGMDSLMGTVASAQHDFEGMEQTPYLPPIESNLTWYHPPEALTGTPQANEAEEGAETPEPPKSFETSKTVASNEPPTPEEESDIPT